MTGAIEVPTQPRPLARFILLAGLALFSGCGSESADRTPRRGAAADWPAYGRSPGGARYSPLDEITRDNVHALEPAWVFHTGEIHEMEPTVWRNSSFQATPLLVEGTLYLCSSMGRAIALDPETGTERWRHDPRIDRTQGRPDPACRGVSAWIDPDAALGSRCRLRIYLPTNDARLIALDGATGEPCSGFGVDGTVNLARGITPSRPGSYGVTSPPVVIGGLVVVGSQIGDNQRSDEASGVVRAYDARTGDLRWLFF